MKEIKLYRSRKIAARFMFACFCFNLCILCGIYYMEYVFWFYCLSFIVVGLISFAFFISLFHFFDKRPAIIINEIGIVNPRSKYGMINWEIIEDAYIRDLGSKTGGIIYFNVAWPHDPYLKAGKWKRKLIQLNKDLGHEVLKVVIDDVDVDKKKLLSFIQEMIKLSNTGETNRQKMIESWKEKM